MIDYTYKAKFEFDLGSGSADGEVRARGVSDAVLLVESELREVWDALQVAYLKNGGTV